MKFQSCAKHGVHVSVHHIGLQMQEYLRTLRLPHRCQTCSGLSGCGSRVLQQSSPRYLTSIWCGPYTNKDLLAQESISRK